VSGGDVDVAGQGFDVEWLCVFPVDAVPDPPQQGQVAQALYRDGVAGHGTKFYVVGQILFSHRQWLCKVLYIGKGGLR
jgi:hypothetical protein